MIEMLFAISALALLTVICVHSAALLGRSKSLPPWQGSAFARLKLSASELKWGRPKSAGRPTSAGKPPLKRGPHNSLHRLLSRALILALLLQMLPLPLAPLGPSGAPASPRLSLPSLASRLDLLPRPALAYPTAGITVTKSAPASVNQTWNSTAGTWNEVEIQYDLILLNPSAYTISIGSLITDATPTGTVLKSGNPAPGWFYGSSSGNPLFQLGVSTSTTSIPVGSFYVTVTLPVRDGTVITNSLYCFSGTVSGSPTSFCETTPVTTVVRAPDFSLVETAPTPVCAGQRLTYTLYMSNPGGVDVTQPFTVVAVITAPLTIFTDSLSADATSSGQLITWTINTPLAANGGTTISRTFAVSVPATLANGTYLTNTYTVTSPEFLPNRSQWTSQGVVVHKPTAAFTSSAPVCLGNPVYFYNNSTGTSSYLWDFGDGVTSTLPSPSHTYSAAGDYTVTLTATSDVGCGVAVTQSTVTINPLPVVSFSTSTPCCTDRGIQFTFTGSGATSLLWDFGDGSTSTVVNPTHVYTAAGTYTVTLIATNTYGCSDTATDTITVHEVTAVFTRTPSGPVCVGQTIQFTDTSTTTAASIVAWEWDFGDGTIITGTATPTYAYAAPGTYTVWLTATDDVGCSDVTSSTVFVDGIRADFQPTAPLTVCTGVTVVFTSTSAVSSTITHHVWDFGDGTITDTGSIPTVTHAYVSGGYYTVILTVTNSTGCSDVISRTNLVFVDALAPDFLPGSPVSVCVGATVYFTDTGHYSGTVQSRTWDFGDGWVVSGPASTISHQYNTPGYHTVMLTVTTTSGCVAAEVKPNLVFVDDVTADFIPSAPISVCVGTTVQFTDTSTAGSGIVAWEWNFGDGTVITGTANPTHTYTTPGYHTVTLTVTNATGCSAVETKANQVFVDGIAAGFQRTPAGNVCLNQTVLFTSTSSVSGTITHHRWDFGDGTITDTGSIPTASHVYVVPGTYTVTLTVSNSTGCADVAVDVITVNPDVVADFTRSPTGPVCVGATIVFTDASGGGPTAWEWSFGDGITATGQVVNHAYVTPGTYTVWLTATGPCGQDVVSEVITVTATPAVSITRSPVGLVCVGESVVFTGTNSGGQVDTWEWNFGDELVSGTLVIPSTATGQVVSHTYSTAGDYTVWLTATGPCGQDVVSTTVSVNAAPEAAFNRIPAGQVAAGTVITFTDASSGNPTAWEWNLGDGTIITGTSVVTHAYATTGTYTAVLTAANSCGSDVYSETITVTTCTAVGGASFTFAPAVPLVAETVTFTGSVAYGSSPVTYTWNFGDGSIASGLVVTHAYATTGTFTVLMTATNPCGQDVYSQAITVAGCVPVSGASFTYQPVSPVVNESITFTASVTAGSAPITYTWNFGDGLISGTLVIPAGTATGPVVTYTYAFTGTYTVVLTAANPCGQDVYSAPLTVSEVAEPTVFFVHLPLIMKNYACGLPTFVAEVPVGAHPKGLAAADGRVYVSLYDTSRLVVLDATTFDILAIRDLGGVHGNGVAVSGGKVYVANRESASVSVFDASTYNLLRTVEVGQLPFGVAAAGGWVHVSNFGSNSVSILDGATDTVIATAATGERPALLTALDNRAYVPNSGGSGVTRVNADGSSSKVPGTSGPAWFAATADPTTGRIYVTKREGPDTGVYEIDPDTGIAHWIISMAPAYAVAYNPTTDHLFVVAAEEEQLYVYNATTHTLIGTLPLNLQNEPSEPEQHGGQGIAVLNNMIYVTNYRAGTISVFQDHPCW